MSEQKQTMLKKRYLAPNEKTEGDMFRRVANFIGQDEPDDIRELFYYMMKNHYFLPNTPTLINAGRPESSGQLAACFVLPVGDSMYDIFTTLRDMAIIQKTGGGVGYDFSRLRPKGANVTSSLGTASGPISFMKAYDAATDTIKQGGVRRGANMGVLKVNHPDIEEFITCKTDTDELTNFNISVAITDNFMDAVKNNAQFPLIFNGEVYKLVNARELWNKIVHQAWLNGEPGIIFIDRINEKHPIKNEEIEATNPCGEQPLLPYESCNLGSINLSKMVKPDGTFDWDKLYKVICHAVRFLDDVIDKNVYPLKEIEEKVKANRKIGLGVMGYADMLVKMGLKYGSEEAIKFTEELARFIKESAIETSNSLASERGVFPNWKNSIWKDKDIKMRNATVTTIAPTGSISIIAEASSGIEPIFGLYYEINRMDTTFIEYHPLFKEMLEEEGLFEEFEKTKKVPEHIRNKFILAHEVTPEQHVRTQAIWQKYVDNAVSKTINLPNNATEKDVDKAYWLAYEWGCKGITVYRDGSRGAGVLSTKKTNKPTEIREALEVSPGIRHKITTGCGTLYMMVFTDDNGVPREVFINTSNGGCVVFTQATSRLISLALRGDIPVERVIDQLESSGSCPSYQYARGKGKEVAPGKSCPSAIAKILKSYLEKGMIIQQNNTMKEKCPECGNPIDNAEGCATCHYCGYSKCS